MRTTGRAHGAMRASRCRVPPSNGTGATIGMTGGYWYVSIQVEVKSVSVVNTHPVVGVDVGIKAAAVLSDGRRFENQKPLTRQLNKLKRLSRAFSRKRYDPATKHGSQNREKARVKL